MKRIVVASMEKGAGKTSMIVGLSKAHDLKIGYMKPLGERIFYRKKRLLDYDSVLMRNLFELDESAEELSLGFDHSKLRFMYDTETLKRKVMEIMDQIGKGRITRDSSSTKSTTQRISWRHSEIRFPIWERTSWG